MGGTAFPIAYFTINQDLDDFDPATQKLSIKKLGELRDKEAIGAGMGGKGGLIDEEVKELKVLHYLNERIVPSMNQ